MKDKEEEKRVAKVLNGRRSDSSRRSSNIRDNRRMVTLYNNYTLLGIC